MEQCLKSWGKFIFNLEFYTHQLSMRGGEENSILNMWSFNKCTSYVDCCRKLLKEKHHTHNKGVNQERRRHRIRKQGIQLRKEAKGVPRMRVKGYPWRIVVQQVQIGADQKAPGAPGQLRSWSHGAWIPSPLGILCLPLSLPLPYLLVLSLSQK